MYKDIRGRKLTPAEIFLTASLAKSYGWYGHHLGGMGTTLVVERSFGTLKKVQGFVRSRYLGRDKVEMEFHLHALAHNLKKAVNLSA